VLRSGNVLGMRAVKRKSFRFSAARNYCRIRKHLAAKALKLRHLAARGWSLPTLDDLDIHWSSEYEFDDNMLALRLQMTRIRAELHIPSLRPIISSIDMPASVAQENDMAAYRHHIVARSLTAGLKGSPDSHSASQL
jgi:hypothetical protein